MGNGQSTSSGTKVLAKVARGDARAAQQVEDARAGYFQTSKGRRAALAVAAERGNCQLLASVYESAEQAKGSWQTRQDFLNAPGSKGQTLLMTSCNNGHLECLTYLLSKGADVMATNPKGETCLHIAAKNGHSSCVVRLLSSRINTPGAATRLADLVFTEGLEEVKYVDLHNLAGMTALHVAALNGTAATVQAVLASGASVDAQIMGSNLTPWLSRGSTALHIAAARGFHAVVDVLLAAQTPESGLDLRRMRNHRGLKPFQLARANGHSSIARQLCDTRSSRARRDRRRTRTEGGVDSQKATTPEALLTMLIQRAKLLLTLKAMGSAPSKGLPGGMSLLAVCTNGQVQENKVEQAAAEVLECSDAWRKGSATAKPASSILRLLGALDELPAAAMLNASYAQEGNAEKQKSNSSFASAAMVQAALNAMASSASADPMEASSASLTPTTPLAAAVILQAALRSLTGGKKRSSGGSGHSRRSRQGPSSTLETPASSPHAPHTSRHSLENQRGVAAASSSGPTPPGAGGHPAVPVKPASQTQQQQQQPTTPRTPRTPRTHTPMPTVTPAARLSFTGEQYRPSADGQSTPHRLPPQSVPSTPQPAAESGGNGAALGGNVSQQGLVGRGVGGSPNGAPQQQMLLPEAVPALSRQSLSPSGQATFSSLPSAEDIDALCDMNIEHASFHSESAKLGSPNHQTAAAEPAVLAPDSSLAPKMHLAPILTNAAPGTYLGSAEGPSSSGVQTMPMSGAFMPQYTSSSQFKQGTPAQSRQLTPAGQFEAPESSVPYSQSMRIQSECGSSAYDEGTSSTLIHATSEEGNDDIFYDNSMDAQQHDRDDEGPGRRAEQLNTMELHGILGQHGYKVPELVGEPEEEEESDGEDEGDGDEDLDDNEEDDADDGDDDSSDKTMFQTMPSRRRGDHEEDEGLCSICMDRPLEAQIAGCDHQMCLQCAYQMCARGLASPLCPFCRGPINTFQPVQR